jgi:hypothetical protein
MRTNLKFQQKIVYLFLVAVIFSACKKDFLDRNPLDALSAKTFFNTAADVRTYVNSMYDTRFPVYKYTAGVNNNNARLDLGSDFLIISADVTGSLNQISATGVAGAENASWSTGYARIRQDNYLLSYAPNKVEKTAAAAHYIGEGYFFRAWDYFNLLKTFGDVPLITELVSDTSISELYAPRTSRNEVAKQIIRDLDSAISKLYWKGEGEAVAGRVNKESAIVFKARVALYEGSWEYYHGKKGSPFAVPGKDGKEFLQMIEPAVQQLIDHQGTKIFKKGTEPYNQLFAQSDMSVVDGAFLYRVYDASKLNVSHSFYLKVTDAGPSITDHLADLYLNKDGTPQIIPTPYPSLDTLSQQLDPRFRQTIWTPDRGPLGKVPGRGQDANLRYPIIAPILSATAGYTSTGYRIWKGAVLNTGEAIKGETDDLFIRYAEGLLDYAEAKAILGTITQADLDETVNVLRDRVGMAHMDLAQVASFPDSIYSPALGFTPGEPNIVNEIRRERSVELALEGFRLDDIKRWAVYENVINGYLPKGAQLQEFLDYFNNPSALTADGFNTSGLVFPLLYTSGPKKNVAAFPESGRINPYFKSPQFQPGGQGFFINKDRDYLSYIPLSQIQLYKEEANVTLTQNPGWQ